MISANQDERSGSRKRFLSRQAGLWGLSVVVAALIGAGTAMTAGDSKPIEMLPGNCPPGALKGALQGAPRLVLAIDQNMDVQGFYMPGGQPGKPSAQPDETVDIAVDKTGTETTYCYKVGGVERCVEY